MNDSGGGGRGSQDPEKTEGFEHRLHMTTRCWN